jgi:hypothetical protein
VINLGDLAWSYTVFHNAIESAAFYASVQESTEIATKGSSSCVTQPSVQNAFEQSLYGPLSPASAPAISLYWGGTLESCNPAGTQAPAQNTDPPLPGGDVLVYGTFTWEPIAMPLSFMPITISASSLQSVMQAPGS